MDLRNDFASFPDPMATYTSLGADVDTSFVADSFPFGRRTSVLSSNSSGPTMSFGSSPTDAASNSIPTTPIADSQRSAGALTPADMMMTPESPCPPSWRSTTRHPSQMLAAFPQQRYPNACQDLTRSMMTAGPGQYHHECQPPQLIFGRDAAFAALDPIQTQYSMNAGNRGTAYPGFSSGYTALPPHPMSASFSDDDACMRSWKLEEEDLGPRSQPFGHHVGLQRNRAARRRSNKDPDARVSRSAHKCPHPGCNDRRFQRKEHLRRHQDSVHNEKKFECLQGRILGARFCDKLHGIKPISRSDNVNQHSCTHVIVGMGKTRNALCELAVAEACIRKDLTTQAQLDKANKQCEAVRLHFGKNVEESAVKCVRTAKPKPNVHISHDIMAELGFDCSQGCPMGDAHVFEGQGGQIALCMAFIGNPERQEDVLAELDGDVSELAASRQRKAKL